MLYEGFPKPSQAVSVAIDDGEHPIGRSDHVLIAPANANFFSVLATHSLRLVTLIAAPGRIPSATNRSIALRALPSGHGSEPMASILNNRGKHCRHRQKKAP
ncbi:hypothetical protein [Burkholderia contaminans]|uniref:hypothetical protein n=2 Tax=Burkholderia contaminans TaxID=488447 RepID=UPI000F57B2A0|nr:hypothetical protein [Burkholderia contaminans]